jgi:hypothetical protein
MTAIGLFYPDAAPAKQIMADFQPVFTKDTYLAFERGPFKKERYKAEGKCVFVVEGSVPIQDGLRRQ